MNRIARIALILAAPLLAALSPHSAGAQPVTLRVGHVNHDHHAALYVAADCADALSTRTGGIRLQAVEDRKRYELHDGDKKLADVEIVVVGGGAKMPAALTQGVIDVGLGGVAAVLAACDQGAPVRLIAPLHSKGDMFVVRPDLPVKTWEEFVQLAKKSEKPLRIGYKEPQAVAKLVFEEALAHEGIAYGGDPMDARARVIMVNVKGGGQMNTALGQGIIDGYAGNNPFPAIAADKGIGRVVADLEALPPGTLRNHPCCCVAGRIEAMGEKGAAVEALLAVMIAATDLMNAEPARAAAVAARWIGTSEKVERESMATSGYGMDASADWHARMAQWLDAMTRLGAFTGKLKGLAEPEAGKLAYDFVLLHKAHGRLAKH